MSRLFKLIIIYLAYFVLIAVFLFLVLSSNNRFSNRNSALSNCMDTKMAEVSGNYFDNNKKYIILTFDDGWSSQYKAFKMLKGFKGTLYISSSLIEQKDRLTLDNLTEMYNSGWDICNHTVHHVNLTKVDLVKAYNEIYGCSSWIAGHGFTRDVGYKHFAYPEGSYNSDIIEILKKQSILTARTTNSGNDTADFLQLGRTSLYGMTKKNIHDNILSDEKLLILSFHRIIPDDSAEVTEIDLKESYFKEVINSIIESKREVITITEWYKLNIACKGQE